MVGRKKLQSLDFPDPFQTKRLPIVSKKSDFVSKRVVEHVTVGFENIPIWLRDMTSSFVAIGSGKVKWAVNECILMCQIMPFTKGE